MQQGERQVADFRVYRYLSETLISEMFIFYIPSHKPSNKIIIKWICFFSVTLETLACCCLLYCFYALEQDRRLYLAILSLSFFSISLSLPLSFSLCFSRRVIKYQMYAHFLTHRSFSGGVRRYFTHTLPYSKVQSSKSKYKKPYYVILVNPETDDITAAIYDSRFMTNGSRLKYQCYHSVSVINHKHFSL
jgi:hypothetical protein